jgi:hypothetical protein
VSRVLGYSNKPKWPLEGTVGTPVTTLHGDRQSATPSSRLPRQLSSTMSGELLISLFTLRWQSR